jgi:toxin-antitoxin system PIN domain toxin
MADERVRPLLRVAEPPTPWLWGLEGAARGDLPDVNVWLALAVQEHPHHEQAQRYWASSPAPGPALGSLGPDRWFCRVTMLGLVRLLCQPRAVGPGALDLRAAWQLYTQYRSLPRIGLLSEPGSCDDELRTLVSAVPLPARLWTDAYLAALARASGLRLVTFDRDFERFGLERCLILEV